MAKKKRAPKRKKRVALDYTPRKYNAVQQLLAHLGAVPGASKKSIAGKLRGAISTLSAKKNRSEAGKRRWAAMPQHKKDKVLANLKPKGGGGAMSIAEFIRAPEVDRGRGRKRREDDERGAEFRPPPANQRDLNAAFFERAMHVPIGGGGV